MKRGDGGNLKPAIDFFGSQIAIARKFEIKKSRVNHWTNPQRGVPAFWAMKIEEATNGVVTAKMLIPELNGESKLSEEE